MTVAPYCWPMHLTFTGALWYWRGPSPYHFVTVPEDECVALASVSGLVSYGWGMIPVTGRVGESSFTTALFPKNGGYVVPIKDAVRVGEQLVLDDLVTVHLEVAVQAPRRRR